jgi:ribose transport system ATP-binding protein
MAGRIFARPFSNSPCPWQAGTRMSAPLLSVQGVSKRFGSVQALAGVRLELRKGEVHALMGENGAGKSTLMNILGGIFRPDEGEILLAGESINPTSPAESQRLGIGLVHQEIALCPDVSVAENIFMSATSRSEKWTFDPSELNRKATEVLAQLHAVPVTERAGSLPIASQQIVEIAKALTLDCKVLILDEPTAALTETEADALFAIIRKLKGEGIGIIYISHRMAEIFSLADRVTIFRDGSYVTTLDVGSTRPEEVAAKMVGRSLPDLFPEKRGSDADPRLSVSGIVSGKSVREVGFDVRPGEIVGLGGLIGSGRTETALAICGLAPRTGGRVCLDGREITIEDYPGAIRHGLVYLSEDRKGSGIFLDLSIAKNISALALRRVSGLWSVDVKQENDLAERMRKRLDIRCASIQQPVSALSGGNQQKVALAKLLAVDPKVIFVDEPTRGVDIGAKVQIYAILRELAEAGAAVVMISSEMPELIGLCDRIVVLHEGRVAGEVSGQEMNEENIMHLASGLGPRTKPAKVRKKSR